MLTIEQAEARIEQITSDSELSLKEKNQALDAFLESQDKSKDLNEIKKAVEGIKFPEINFPEPLKEIKVQIPGVELITIQGIPGEPGKTPSDTELRSLIKPLIPKAIPGKDGKNYVLTSKDKKEIASKIEVPIVEKVIERTEVIKEQPIITNEIKEVAVSDTGEQIIGKINTTPIDKEEYLIDVSHVKGFKKLLQKSRSKNEQSFSASIGPIIQDEGVSLPQEIYLSFVGAGVSVTDDPTNHRTVVTISGGASANESNGELLTDSGDHINFTFANAPTGISVVWRGETGQIQLPSSYSAVSTTLTFSESQIDGDGNPFTIYANSKY